MQVTMADDVGSRPGRMIRQPAGHAGQVRAAELDGGSLQCREQPGYRHGHLADLLELAAHQVRVERVQPRHRRGQQIRDLAQQPQHGGRAQPAGEPGKRRAAGRPVHHHERPAQAVVRAAGHAHERSRETRGGHGALHDRLLARRAGVGHEPGNQLGRPAIRRVR